MVYSYRRRGYRRYRRRPMRRRFSKRIGRRNNRRTRNFSRRTRKLRPMLIGPGTNSHTRFDRTINFDGDATLAQFREVSYGELNRAASGAASFFVGAFVPGSHFGGQIVPWIDFYRNQYGNYKVVKTTVVVQFFNAGAILKDVGILQLPTGIDSDGELPTWDASIVPGEQPRGVKATLGAGTSSRSVRKLVASGSPLTSMGDKELITSGDTTLATADPITTAPTSPWAFWIYQGNSGSPATALETAANNVQYKLTVYRTCKFFNRSLITS